MTFSMRSDAVPDVLPGRLPVPGVPGVVGMVGTVGVVGVVVEGVPGVLGVVGVVGVVVDGVPEVVVFGGFSVDCAWSYCSPAASRPAAKAALTALPWSPLAD